MAQLVFQLAAVVSIQGVFQEAEGGNVRASVVAEGGFLRPIVEVLPFLFLLPAPAEFREVPAPRVAVMDFHAAGRVRQGWGADEVDVPFPAPGVGPVQTGDGDGR